MAVVRAYREDIDGAVVYDPMVPATSNVASTIAGVENLLAVRYDPSPNSLYTQLILQGPRLPARVWLLNEDGSSKFIGQGMIPDIDMASTGSAKCDSYLWMKHRYMDTGRCNCLYGGYYVDYAWQPVPDKMSLNHHTLTNHDFFVSKRAFFFDLGVWADEPATDDPQQPPGLDRDLFKQIMLSAYRQTGGQKIIHIGGFPSWALKYTRHAGGRHHEVHTEWEFALLLSAYNACKDADAINIGAMANASFWTHFPLRDRYPQTWVSHDDLRQRGYLTADGKVDFRDRQFIIFYVGDYDAASWLYQSAPTIWDDPQRGEVPMMWCMSPLFEQRAPQACHYVRTTATEKDYFAAADNGAGYLNPSLLQQGRWPEDPRLISSLPSGLQAWTRHCAYYYRRWGLSITGFIIDGFAPPMTTPVLDAYAQFSPNGIVPQKCPLTALYKDMPIMRFGDDVNEEPLQAAEHVVRSVAQRPVPFHWFRNILKTPSWYVQTVEQIRRLNPSIKLLDAPSFFELYRIYLRNHPEAAQGQIKMPDPFGSEY